MVSGHWEISRIFEYYTPETDITQYVNYTGIKLKNNASISNDKILIQVIFLKGTITIHFAKFANLPESHTESDLLFSS